MMKKKLVTSTVALGISVMILLAGCSSGTNETVGTEKKENQSSNAKKDVTFVMWNGNNADDYKKATNYFNESQDEVNLTFEMQTGDYNTYLGAKTAANDLPDMFVLTPYSQVEQFAKNGKIVDLSDQPFVDKIYSNTKNSITYEGKIYAYPLAQDFMGMFYNVEYFEKAGITEVPKTIDEFEEVCEKLQAAGYTPIAATYKDTEAYYGVCECIQTIKRNSGKLLGIT